MRISTYPKKFAHSITVEIVSENDGHCIISLTNQKGRIRMMMGVNLTEGQNNILVDGMGILEVGAYCLEVKNTEAKVLYYTEVIKQ
jgi:hypothetical protein